MDTGMDIGGKIKAARVRADLTQEQAAESLGVSRQTISNWENGKTYPDIVSVVKMSGLYQVSLDQLLKEPASADGYLHYLEKSTDVVGSRARLSKFILAAVTLGIWAFAVIAFWLFTGPSDAMGYSLMFLWVLLPVTGFVVSLLIGESEDWGRGRWLIPLPMGILYMLADYATFEAANMAAFHRVNPPDLMLLPIGAAISLIGVAIGAGIRRLRKGDIQVRLGGKAAGWGRLFQGKLPFYGILLLCYYLLPALIRDTGGGILLLLGAMPLICLITGYQYGKRYALRPFFALLAAALFFPSVFLYYNGSAWVYAVAYGAIALLGNLLALPAYRRRQSQGQAGADSGGQER